MDTIDILTKRLITEEEKYAQLVKIDTSKAMDYFHNTLTLTRQELRNVYQKQAEVLSNSYKTEATPLDNELFKLFITELEKSSEAKVGDCWHYGKVDIGAVVRLLLRQYTVTKNV